MHSHPAGERGVDFERLVGGTAAGGGRLMGKRAHIVQPVGELDQQHPHIIGHRQEKLAEIFRLLGLFGDEFEPLQFGQAFDQQSDFVAKYAIDFRTGGVGVFDRVV